MRVNSHLKLACLLFFSFHQVVDKMYDELQLEKTSRQETIFLRIYFLPGKSKISNAFNSYT
jgi:hypothetical protein